MIREWSRMSEPLKTAVAVRWVTSIKRGRSTYQLVLSVNTATVLGTIYRPVSGDAWVVSIHGSAYRKFPNETHVEDMKAYMLEVLGVVEDERREFPEGS